MAWRPPSCSFNLRMLRSESTSRPCSQITASTIEANRSPREGSPVTGREQRLELPGLAPLGVVLRIRVEAPRERPDRALWPQVGIDEEPRTVVSAGGQSTDDGQGKGQSGSPACRFVITEMSWTKSRSMWTSSSARGLPISPSR